MEGTGLLHARFYLRAGMQKNVGTIFTEPVDRSGGPASYPAGDREAALACFERIRNTDGLSYGVGSQYSAPPIDDIAQFVAFADALETILAET